MYWTHKNVSENVFKETFIKKLSSKGPFQYFRNTKKGTCGLYLVKNVKEN